MPNVLLLSAVFLIPSAGAIITRAFKQKTLKLLAAVILTVVGPALMLYLLLSKQTEGGRLIIDINKPAVDLDWIFIFLSIVLLIFILYKSIQNAHGMAAVLSIIQILGLIVFRILNPLEPGRLRMAAGYSSLIPLTGLFIAALYIAFKGIWKKSALISAYAGAAGIIAVFDSTLWVYFSAAALTAILILDKQPKRSQAASLLFSFVILAGTAVLFYFEGSTSMMTLQLGGFPVSLLDYPVKIICLIPLYYLLKNVREVRPEKDITSM